MSWQPRQRGFALLTVLWTLAFLSLLGTGLLAGARQNAQRVRNLVDAAVVEATAEAALHRTIFALLDPTERRWQLDGAVHALRFGDIGAAVRVEDESGKVNPNIATPELLEALLRQLGADRASAARIATAIGEWRSPLGGQGAAAASPDRQAPSTVFESLDDLAAIAGMTPALHARLRPHLSLYTTSDPDVATTDPVVAAALGLPGPASASGRSMQEVSVVTVTTRVEGPRRTRFAERVSLRLNALPDIRRYEILAREPLLWREDVGSLPTSP